MAIKRDFLLITSGRIATVMVALISIRAVTTFLSPEQFGKLALLNAILTFCGLFLINPVGQYINLHTHAWWDDGSLMLRLRSYRRYILLVGIIGLIATFILDKDAPSLEIVSISFVMLFMVFSSTWNATLIPMLNMLGFRAQSVVLTILTLLVGLAMSIIFTSIYPSAISWFFGQAIGMGIGALGGKYIFQYEEKERQTPIEKLPLINFQVALNYCAPLALATGLMWVQISGYRFLIDSYWGLEQLGFLAVGLQVAAQIWGLIESLAMQFLNPLFYRRVSNHRDQQIVQVAYSDLLNTLLPLYFVFAGCLIAGAPYLLKALVAEQYHGTAQFVVLGAGIEMCRVLGNLLSNAAHVTRKVKSLLLPYAVGAVVLVFLICYFGDSHKSIEWAGVGLFISAFIMLLVMGFAMYKQIKFGINFTRCLAGFFIMLMMLIASPWLPDFSGLPKNVAILVAIGILGSSIMFLLLRSNPSAMRFLDTQLRN